MVSQKTSSQEPRHFQDAATGIGRPNMSEDTITSTPIGYLESCFKQKAGTPRQPTVCDLSKAKLTISRSIFNNPEHSLDGIEKFSHLWVVFVFHMNEGEAVKAKVKPPRLDGVKVGVFATRSPHRPNPIGLTLAKLDKVEGDTLHLSGIDILDGTPILDIKPYIPVYDGVSADSTSSSAEQSRGRENATEKGISAKDTDSESFPEPHQKRQHLKDNSTDDNSKEKSRPDETAHSSENWYKENSMSGAVSTSEQVTVASWVTSPPVQKLTVSFTPNAEATLQKFHSKGPGPDSFTLAAFKDSEEAKKAICDILSADPRSPYFRNKCQDRLYFFSVDNVHVTCWFDGNSAEVVRVQPVLNASCNTPSQPGVPHRSVQDISHDMP
ncbi:TRMO [Branchiostoma lanceolatum]|uniref:TRMO protein n=1 Tax=Branchiostoma lanceolatum TaxID=7740 RepID=A0A8K0EKE0_BRALA|nr:TRMO [Branchiostoma lanceolatum]